jgi:hypothetical protein
MKRLSILVLIFGFLTACKKDGCTDSTATNYDSKSNGSGNCEYTTPCEAPISDVTSVEITPTFEIYFESVDTTNTHNNTININLSNQNDSTDFDLTYSISLGDSQLESQRLTLDVVYTIKTTNATNNVEFDFNVYLNSDGIYDIQLANQTTDNGKVGVYFQFYPNSNTFAIKILV